MEAKTTDRRVAARSTRLAGERLHTGEAKITVQSDGKLRLDTPGVVDAPKEYALSTDAALSELYCTMMSAIVCGVLNDELEEMTETVAGAMVRLRHRADGVDEGPVLLDGRVLLHQQEPKTKLLSSQPDARTVTLDDEPGAAKAGYTSVLRLRVNTAAIRRLHDRCCAMTQDEWAVEVLRRELLSVANLINSWTRRVAETYCEIYPEEWKTEDALPKQVVMVVPDDRKAFEGSRSGCRAATRCRSRTRRCRPRRT